MFPAIYNTAKKRKGKRLEGNTSQKKERERKEGREGGRKEKEGIKEEGRKRGGKNIPGNDI